MASSLHLPRSPAQPVGGCGSRGARRSGTPCTTPTMTKRLDIAVPIDSEGSESSDLPDEVHVAIFNDSDVVLARRNGRALAADLGFTSPDLALIAATISELAHNLLAYASRGEITMRTTTDLDRVGLVVI